MTINVFEHLVLACTMNLLNDLDLLEILILSLRNFTKLPVLRYLGIFNVLYIRIIPTYRVCRLYAKCIRPI